MVVENVCICVVARRVGSRVRQGGGGCGVRRVRRCSSLARSNAPVKGGDAANLCKSRLLSASRLAAPSPRPRPLPAQCTTQHPIC